MTEDSSLVEAGIIRFIKGSRQRKILLCEAKIDFGHSVKRTFPTVQLRVFNTEEWQLCQQKGMIPALTGRFDCIVLGHMLEEVPDPEKFIHLMKKFLEEDGQLICVFDNMRSWRVWQMLMGQYWYYGQPGVFGRYTRQRFTISDVCMLFNRCSLRRIQAECVSDKIPDKIWEDIRMLQIMIDRSELETRCWILSVQRYDEKTTWLRQQYTPEIREKISLLLHRIENNIEQTLNLQRLSVLCNSEKIQFTYLKKFIENVTIEPARMVKLLSNSGMGHKHGR